MNTLKGLRGLRDLSQKDLAEKAGMTQTEVSHIENGLRPTEKQLEKISRAFGLRENTA